jgi:hypothetical protein
MAAAVHEDMLPTCVDQFAETRTEVRNMQEDIKEVKADVKHLDVKLDEGFKGIARDITGVLEAVATLKERSRNWGVIGGAIVSIFITIAGGVALAVIL